MGQFGMCYKRFVSSFRVTILSIRSRADGKTVRATVRQIGAILRGLPTRAQDAILPHKPN
jgi:hypothetical protein